MPIVRTVSRIRLTAGRVESFTCPVGKSQAFLWDTGAPALALRATPTGRRTYVFEGRLEGATIRIPIGTVADWSLGDARAKASDLKRMVDSGIDPRQAERERKAEESAVRLAAETQARAHAVTVGDAWPLYLKNGKGKRAKVWKPRYRADLEAMAKAGGAPKKRGEGVTRPGPLFPLMAWPLVSVDEDRLAAWHRTEAEAGPHQAARALMMLRGFLRWCSTRPEYRDLVDRDAAKAPAVVDNLPAAKRRTDALEAAQVAPWWQGTEALSNRTAAAYLRALLLTGARREEVAALQWKHVDLRWKKLTIADKVEDARVLPLTPYLAQLLAGLPRINDFVFASTGKSGRIADARASHEQVLNHAGIERLTFHGLRRSFSLLGEAAGAPAGAIAQVMGHKPSAVAEGYRPRSVDALRPYLARVEAHILELAGVQFVPSAEPGKLRAV